MCYVHMCVYMHSVFFEVPTALEPIAFWTQSYSLWWLQHLPASCSLPGTSPPHHFPMGVSLWSAPCRETKSWWL